jgi:hypothetical protein
MTIVLVDGGEVEAGLGWDALTHSPGTAPSAPQALAATTGTVDPTDIVVTWTEPADKGGWSTLEGYEVELNTPGAEIDFMPTMTASNAPAPYVVSASSQYSAAYAGWYAFDDIVNGSNGWFSAATGQPWWLKIDLGTARTVTAFLWSPYRLDAYGYANFPKDWQFQGSNDDATWTTLVSATNYSISDNDTRVEVANETAYRYYRWYITLTGDGSYCLIADIRLLESGEPLQEIQTGASSPITFLAKPLETTYDIRARARNFVGWGDWAGPISYLHASFPFASDILGWFTAQDTSHANGAAVDTWTSSFGGKTLTKYSATSAPTKRTNHRNGLAAIEFDGVDDNLKSATPFANSSSYTVVLVGQFGGFEGSVGLFDFGGHSLYYGNTLGIWSSRFHWRRNNAVYVGPASMTAPTYNNLPFIIVLSNNSTGYIQSTIRINGTTYVNDTDTTTYGTEIMQHIRLGTDQDSPHRGPQFFVYEFGCYSSPKSLTDRAAILAHFQSKYAIA